MFAGAPRRQQEITEKLVSGRAAGDVRRVHLNSQVHTVTFWVMKSTPYLIGHSLNMPPN